MLKHSLQHPEILAALASAGHSAKVLISDGHFPHSTKPNPRAKVVHANFAPGVVDAVTIAGLVADTVAIEAAEVMAPAKTGPYAMRTDPPIWKEYRRILAERGDFREALVKHDRFKFYAQTRGEDVCLVIATAETQIYANLLLTIGVAR